MCIKVQSSVFLRLLLFCLISAAITGCGPSTGHVGTYIAEIKDSPHHHETILELKETGVGVWRVGDDEVSFSWYVKGNELRLNTKNGGVIVGSLDNGVIHVTLPGPQELFFKKVK
jgi:hypothetical protein